MGISDGAVLGITRIFGADPPSRAFNFAVLAEGFKANQQGAFDSAADAFVATLLATPPFDTVTRGLNVFRINVTSTDSGADDPVTADGGTGATARTYFDASFGQNGIRRLLVCDSRIVLPTAARMLPEFSVALVVVNSDVHGGSGGAVATYSLAMSANEIALHEIGHSAFHLADEYPSYGGGDEPDRRFHPPVEPSEPNVTIAAPGRPLKWKSLLTPGVALPTMANPDCAQPDPRPSPVAAGTVGLFEGANYYHCRAYRPEFNCKMRTIGAPFCAVCRQVISARVTARIPEP